MQSGYVGTWTSQAGELVVSVFGAVERDLKRLPDHLAQSTLAATAKALAQELDSSANSATSKSMCAKALQDTMRELRELAPPEEKKGQLHDIKSGRALRLADGGSAA
jgi:hypothetical protein